MGLLFIIPNKSFLEDFQKLNLGIMYEFDNERSPGWLVGWLNKHTEF